MVIGGMIGQHLQLACIDNLLVVLGVAAVAGYSMIVDGHCGHWWYDRSTSAASLHEVFCREGKGGGARLANLKVKFRRT